MLAGARWILRQASTVLNDFLRPRPSWRLQIVGHSLGGGTAALLCMMYASCASVLHADIMGMHTSTADFSVQLCAAS